MCTPYPPPSLHHSPDITLTPPRPTTTHPHRAPRVRHTQLCGPRRLAQARQPLQPAHSSSMLGMQQHPQHHMGACTASHWPAASAVHTLGVNSGRLAAAHLHHRSHAHAQQHQHQSLAAVCGRIVWSHVMLQAPSGSSSACACAAAAPLSSSTPPLHAAAQPLAPAHPCSSSSSSTSTSSSSRASAQAPLLLLRSSVDVEDKATLADGSRSSSGRSRGASSSSSSRVALPGVSRGSPTGGGSSSGGGRNDKDDFGANFGEAVIALREDLPLLFQQDPRWHIYRTDITFRTPSLRYSTGLWKYKLLHKAARWLGNLLYADMQLSLTRMWQPASNKKQLRVRWCVSGRPRLSLSVDDKPESTEVISTYTFDSAGRIYEHQVDQIIPPESPLVQLMEWLVGRLQPKASGLQPQLPMPGLRDW